MPNLNQPCHQGIRRRCTRCSWKKLPLKGIFYRGRSCRHQTTEARLESLHRALHTPCYSAITEVALNSRTQPADVFGFSKVHLEQETGTRRERQRIVGRWSGQMTSSVQRLLKGRSQEAIEACLNCGRWNRDAKIGTVNLPQLYAAAVTMHVPVCA